MVYFLKVIINATFVNHPFVLCLLQKNKDSLFRGFSICDFNFHIIKSRLQIRAIGSEN